MAAQLALDNRWTARPREADARETGVRTARPASPAPVLCAACRAHEARYGFRNDGDDPHVDRPRTLCFECFRVEIARRQEAARAVQERLPLEETLETLSLRRRRAQIAARRALAVSGF